MKTCSVEGCQKPAKSAGMCHMHYMRKRRHGSVHREPTKIEDPLVLIKDYMSFNQDTGVFRWIKKPNGRGHPYKVGDIAGGQMINGYRVISFKGLREYAHRLAYWWVFAEMPERIDHINGDRLDNRIENLRPVTALQNSQNSKGLSHKNYKGACYRENKRKWQSCIQVERKFKHLGYYETEIEAAKAYDHAASKYFGDYARLNFERVL